MSTGLTGEPPAVTIVRGRPAAAEIAIITAVLLAVRARADAASGPPAPPARPQWAARSRALPAFPRPGPGGWRASARPH